MGKGTGESGSRSARVAASLAFLALSLAGCSAVPVKTAEGHLRAEAARPEGTVPAPVQVVPLLPQPKPAIRPETYSVVVNNVRVQDLLFALARDAKLQIDVNPDVAGSVTLNAIDQTLPQLLARIARQVDMRYEMDGGTLSVMRDLPFLRAYKIDYVGATRNVTMQSTASSQFGGAGGASSGTTGATATVNVVSNNQLWDQIVVNVRQILEDTDVTAVAQPAVAPPPAAPGAAAPAPAPTPTGPNVRMRESASVIGNRESGVLYVRATSRQHEKVLEFIDQVLTNTRRQVLIEATIAEVQLNNAYQRGIDWSRVRRGTSGTTLRGFSGPALGAEQGVDTAPFVLNTALASIGLDVTLRLLETFGDVRVLSSPKVSVLNNQIALLRVTRDIVYFNVTVSGTPITIAGGTGNVTVPVPINTSPTVAAEGFMMSVLPQISDADSVILNVRPTIRRRVDFAIDPNPSIPAATPNRIPVFETRELDSVLRIQSGQVAVLGGLMQDAIEKEDDTIPGVRDVPLVGDLLTQRRDVRRKTELVIFLRATVVRDPSIEGDYRGFRDLLPGENFLSRPNPGRDPAQAR